MTKRLFLLTLTIFFVLNASSQINEGGKPYSQTNLVSNIIPIIKIDKVSSEWIKQAEEESNRLGKPEFLAKQFKTNLNLKNSGKWEYLINGDRIWRIKIEAKDAKAIMPIFDDFFLPKGANLYLYGNDYKQILGSYTENNNHQSKMFSTEVLYGNALIIEYYEPKEQFNQGSFTLNTVCSFFKGIYINGNGDFDINESDPCQINVNCSPVGDNWQDEKKGVARIYIPYGNTVYSCTGSLINNTAQDCTKYFLTALHCGDDIETSNYNVWVFYFNYEYLNCTNTNLVSSTNTVTGATFVSQSLPLTSSNTSSDFLLLELNSTIPSNYGVYYNGWNIATTTSGGGVGIHHPSGDVKKISTFSATPSNVGVSWTGTNGYSVGSGSTHWSFAWSANSNGHGVTEGGSSGSPLFDSNGYIIGTLSGGGSYCTALTSSDQYGKMSYHWQSNATANNRRLKPWLDPTNSGVTTLQGTYAPCAPIASNDAGILTVSAPTGTVCGTTVTPIVELKNYGTSNLTNVTIKYQVNSGTLSTYNWTGNLAQNATTLVTLTAITAPVGANTFTAFTQNPNNGTDGNTANDSKTENFTVNTTSSLPLVQNFEGTTFPATGFSLSNPDNSTTWAQTSTASFGTGSKAMYIDNWDYNGNGAYDWFLTPTYNFTNVTNATLTYDLAYAYYQQTNGTNTAYDTLGIAVSTDCGASFSWLWKQGGTQLATAGGKGTEFIPTSANWTNKSLSLSSLNNQTSVQFAFISINKYGNNLYIDNININNTPIVTLPVADFSANATSICKNNSIAFTDLTSNTPTSWSWSFPGGTPSTSTAQNPTITYNTAGTYSVTLTATNANGSDAETKTSYITINNTPTLNLTPTNVLCFGGSTGSITAAATGAGGYTYAWTGQSSTSSVLSNLAIGSYTCTVTDVNGCVKSSTAAITQPSSAVSITTSVTNATCGNANGSVIPTATGGVGPYTYTYSNGGNGSNLAAGTYTVTAHDANNCTVSKSFTIANTNTSLVLNLSPTNVSCFNGNNGAITASASGSSGYTYAWTGSTSTSATRTNLAAGSYTCTVTDASGCSVSSSITLTQPTALALTFNTTNAFCNQPNGSVTASATGGVGPYTYAFASGSTNLSPGSYACTVTDSKGCTATSTFTIGNSTQNFSFSVTTTLSSCTGSTGTATVSIVGGTSGYTFAWDNGQTSAIATGLGFGVHTVVVTNPNGCSQTKTFNIANANAPAISLQTTNVLCPGLATGQAIATISGGTPNYNIVWSSSNNTNSTETNLSAGSYSITVTDASSCATMLNFAITQPDPISVAFTKEDEHCDSEDGQIIAAATGGTSSYTYLWNNGDNGNIIIDQAAGTYSVTVTDQNNCVAQSATSIQNIPAATISNIIVTDVSCAKEGNGSILVDLSGGTGALSPSWSNGDKTEDLINVGGGTYTLTIKDSENCISDTIITIAEPSPLVIDLVIVDNSPSATSVITANVSGGSQIYNYDWSNGANTQTISNLAVGTYTLVVTDSENCNADTTINIGNVSIQNTTWIETINLYPNPVKQQLQIDISLKNTADIKLSILNTIGQKVYEQHLNSIQKTTQNINTSLYAEGVYYLQIESEKASEVMKFVKVR